MTADLPPATLKIICSLLHCCKTKLTVNIMQLQKQSNGSGCGVYATACAPSLCNENEPSDQYWDEKKLRLHLLQCFESTSMSIVPASTAAEGMKAVHNVPPFDTLYKGLYCICLLPWHKENLIRYGMVLLYGMVSPKLLVFASPHFQKF